jgi:hypothetical protein
MARCRERNGRVSGAETCAAYAEKAIKSGKYRKKKTTEKSVTCEQEISSNFWGINSSKNTLIAKDTTSAVPQSGKKMRGIAPH